MHQTVDIYVSSIVSRKIKIFTGISEKFFIMFDHADDFDCAESDIDELIEKNDKWRAQSDADEYALWLREKK